MPNSRPSHELLSCISAQGGARCPDLPLGLCPRLWDERHIPSRDADDAAIYGAGLARKQNWPAWLLVAAGISALVRTPPSACPVILCPAHLAKFQVA